MERKVRLLAVCAFLGFLGCHDIGSVTKNELAAVVDEADVMLVASDSTRYKFLKGNYQVTGDTLRGFGLRMHGADSDIVLDAALSFDGILTIETERFSSPKTVLLIGGIAATGLIATKLLFFNHTTPEAASPIGVGTSR